jgi:hypothetical protein
VLRRYFDFLKLAFQLPIMVIKTFIAREESQPNRKGRLRITRVLCKEGHTTLFIFFAIFELRIPVKTATIKPSQHKARNRYSQAALEIPREKLDSIWLALFTDRQALKFLTASKVFTFSSARITISLRHFSREEFRC